MIKYVFKADGILSIKSADKADPQKIGAALASIAERGDGHLKPEAIVDHARDRKSVLHKHFEWDDKVAAESFRLDQARSIVRCIHVESAEAENGTARAYLSIQEASGRSYRALGDVLQSADLQAKVLAAAERDLIAFESRYKQLVDVCELIKVARERIKSRRATDTGRVQASA